MHLIFPPCEPLRGKGNYTLILFIFLAWGKQAIKFLHKSIKYNNISFEKLPFFLLVFRNLEFSSSSKSSLPRPQYQDIISVVL